MTNRTVLEKVLIEKSVAEGRCLLKYQDRVIFVEGNIAPLDVADIEIYKKKATYWLARPIHIHSPSPLRQEPFCKHYGICGGCKWQHLQYEQQLQQKQQQVVDALKRIAKVPFPPVRPILPSEKTLFYRNKLEFTFSNKRWLSKEEIASGKTLEKNALGFHIPEQFDKIVDIETCYLQEDLSNQIRNNLRAFALKHGLSFYDLKNHTGFLRNLVIRNTNTNEWLVLVVFAEENMPAIEQVMRFLQETFPQITSLQYIINKKRNDSYQDQEIRLFAGKPYITATMENLQFRISAKSFFQTNSEQAYKLYCIVREFADLQGSEILYDLYTGTGTIANFLANKVQKVIGIEYVSEAIEDAKINAALNQIHNATFVAGDIKKTLNSDFIRRHGKPDVIITDPPRAGMHESVLKTILKLAPPKLVYVSCNPATQARDVAILAEKYQIAAVQPVDMFPHTHHVENVLQMIRK